MCRADQPHFQTLSSPSFSVARHWIIRRNVFTRNDSYSRRASSAATEGLMGWAVEVKAMRKFTSGQRRDSVVYNSLPSDMTLSPEALLTWRQLHPNGWKGHIGARHLCSFPASPTPCAHLWQVFNLHQVFKSIISMVVTVSFPLTQPSSSALSNRNTVQATHTV